MLFDADLGALLQADTDGFALIDISSPGQRRSLALPGLVSVIDAMGRASSTAQGLSTTITTFERLRLTDHRVYAKVEGRALIGYIKVGQKDLFYQSATGSMTQVRPLCVLDFYVAEGRQRTGFGKRIFDHMLEREATHPAQLAYDRPSPKLIAFLRKHYSLSRFTPQANKFVIFDQFFDHHKDAQRQRFHSVRQSLGCRGGESGFGLRDKKAWTSILYSEAEARGRSGVAATPHHKLPGWPVTPFHREESCQYV